MFEQAQAEVQVALEQSAYPAFLRMVRSGLQSPRPAFSQDALTLNPYGLAEMLSVLQTVKEDEVLLYNDPAGGRRCPESYLHAASLGIFPGVGQRTGGLRVTERSKKGSRCVSLCNADGAAVFQKSLGPFKMLPLTLLKSQMPPLKNKQTIILTRYCNRCARVHCGSFCVKCTVYNIPTWMGK